MYHGVGSEHETKDCCTITVGGVGKSLKYTSVSLLMASASGGSFTPSSWSPGYDFLNDGNEESHRYVTVRGSVNPPQPLLDPLQIP